MYIHEGKPLYLTADRETVVPEGDERARWLLIGDGGQMSDEDAAKYGLLDKPKAKAEPAPNKALHTAPPTKGK